MARIAAAMAAQPQGRVLRGDSSISWVLPGERADAAEQYRRRAVAAEGFRVVGDESRLAASPEACSGAKSGAATGGSSRLRSELSPAPWRTAPSAGTLTMRRKRRRTGRLCAPSIRLPVGGGPITWEAPATTASPARGALTVTRQGTNAAGEVCREYRWSVTIGDETEEIVGTACRDAGGIWRIIKG